MTSPEPADCSTGTLENGVCQPVGGMTPDDLAPDDGTERAPTSLPPAERGDAVPVDAPSPCQEHETEVAAGICVDTAAVFPDATTAPAAPPPAVGLPATGASMIGLELAIAVTITAIGARLVRWAR